MKKEIPEDIKQLMHDNMTTEDYRELGHYLIKRKFQNIKFKLKEILHIE